MEAGRRVAATLVASIALAGTVAACGSDDEDSGSSESASAEEVTVTTGDEEGGEFSWEVEPTATADTKTITYENESKEPHAFVFARINEGYTLEEAYEAEGEKGTADVIVESGRKDSPGPGETVEYTVDKPIEAGDYAMLCPIPGHYQRGQLEEFSIE
jgi:uncharacterized cupredoxin-like copper-binding protein